jgi:DNA-binding NtrC family response regulator
MAYNAELYMTSYLGLSQALRSLGTDVPTLVALLIQWVKAARLCVTTAGTCPWSWLSSAALDEIADLSTALQAKFLRFVQEQSFERVGGDTTIHIDARIMAASNRNLPAEVATHRFREDLYYRLNVVTLRVPALRERPEDILPLAERLLSSAAARNHRGQLHFSLDAEAAIAAYRWPGNVRELRNAVERAVVLSDTDLIGPECLPDTLFQPASSAPPAASSSNLDDLEREQILRVLAQSPTLQDAAETSLRCGVSASATNLTSQPAPSV